jgi:hypothetical protein
MQVKSFRRPGCDNAVDLAASSFGAVGATRLTAFTPSSASETTLDRVIDYPADAILEMSDARRRGMDILQQSP